MPEDREVAGTLDTVKNTSILSECFRHKIERFYTKNGRDILKQDKAVVSEMGVDKIK